MRTIDMSPEEMEHYIARFDDLQPNKARTADAIPPEAREAMTARATKTVIASPDAATPWGDGPIPGPPNFAVVIAECDPGNGPGLHVHQNTTETFTCLTSRFRIEWGDDGQHMTELDRFDTISVPVWSRNSAALSGRARYGRKAPRRGTWCRGLRIYSDPLRMGPIRDQ